LWPARWRSAVSAWGLGYPAIARCRHDWRESEPFSERSTRAALAFFGEMQLLGSLESTTEAPLRSSGPWVPFSLGGERRKRLAVNLRR
jgi:hypothetical protein